MTRFALIAAALAAALTAAPEAAAAPRLNADERAVIRLLNDARGQHGLAPLKASRPLSRAADRHSRDMLLRDFFDHSSSDGTPFDARVRRYARGAGLVGETLAAVPQRRGGADAVVDLWLRSPPHRAIVLDPRFRRVGIGRRWGTLGDARHAVVTADFAA
jgi:uncharacterized protein YkwD